MTNNMVQDVLNKAECLYDMKQIENALDAMGQSITQKLSDQNPLILCVMIGALIPTGHLLTRLNFPLEVDYIHATRYRSSTRGGDLHWLVEPRQSLKDRTVLIVDDIMDGGLGPSLPGFGEEDRLAIARRIISRMSIFRVEPKFNNTLHVPKYRGGDFSLLKN